MLLLRGATGVPSELFLHHFSFNTCSSCEEQLKLVDHVIVNAVSIHAPLARSNFFSRIARKTSPSFNTCSSCEEQPDPRSQAEITLVSIHAPLARSNVSGSSRYRQSRFQYMLLLRGATRDVAAGLPDGGEFQYMLLLRGATGLFSGVCKGYNVSIHAPLARSNSETVQSASKRRFQYMLLLRGATRSSFSSRRDFDVSIHAPLARSN